MGMVVDLLKKEKFLRTNGNGYEKRPASRRATPLDRAAEKLSLPRRLKRIFNSCPESARALLIYRIC
jgi:hypothetical protein